MYNHRLIIASFQDELKSMLSVVGLSEFRLLDEYRQKFKNYLRLAIWIKIRNVVPDQFVEAIKKYVDSKRLDPSKVIVGKDYVKINDELFKSDEVLKLTEYIHHKFPLVRHEKTVDPNSEVIEKKIEDYEPVLVGNGIKIYRIDSAQDGRNLVGGLTSWCIGYSGSNNMWQTYRDQNHSTFFVVFDDNPPSYDQKMVAIDFQKNGIELTDLPNRTGERLSNGWDVDRYLEYLSDKGVDINKTFVDESGKTKKILSNKPIDIKESLQKCAFKLVNYLNLDTIKLWQSGKSKVNSYCAYNDFIFDLQDAGYKMTFDQRTLDYTIENPDAVYYLARYIRLGHTLDDEIVEYLADSVGGDDLLNIYANNCKDIPDEQLEILQRKTNAIRSYFRKQMQINNDESNYTTDDPKVLGVFFNNQLNDYDYDAFIVGLESFKHGVDMTVYDRSVGNHNFDFKRITDKLKEYANKKDQYVSELKSPEFWFDFISAIENLTPKAMQYNAFVRKFMPDIFNTPFWERVMSKGGQFFQSFIDKLNLIFFNNFTYELSGGNITSETREFVSFLQSKIDTVEKYIEFIPSYYIKRDTLRITEELIRKDINNYLKLNQLGLVDALHFEQLYEEHCEELARRFDLSFLPKKGGYQFEEKYLARWCPQLLEKIKTQFPQLLGEQELRTETALYKKYIKLANKYDKIGKYKLADEYLNKIQDLKKCTIIV